MNLILNGDKFTVPFAHGDNPTVSLMAWTTVDNISTIY